MVQIVNGDAEHGEPIGHVPEAGIHVVPIGIRIRRIATLWGFFRKQLIERLIRHVFDLNAQLLRFVGEHAVRSDAIGANLDWVRKKA